jgi:ABC-type Fe3+-hydroxamate transport system substrate-binding protein
VTRVVSLVPSITETLVDWGVDPIAVTRFCEQPGFETVGGTKDPDIAQIVALQPDLVIVNDEENRLEDHDALVAAGLDVHVVRIRSVDDVPPELASLRARLGLPASAMTLPPPLPRWVRAFVPIWRRPWMTVNDDTYGASLLARIGIANACGSAEERFPVVELEDVDADVVLAPSEPYPFSERFRTELEQVAPVQFVDGRDLFWWGARTPAAIERLKTATARLGEPGSHRGEGQSNG